ncbi:hypothetical protein CsSME_00026059 [Camellia sinensis var. sinensis]
MGEAPMLTRAFLLPGPSTVPQLGSATFEIGQPSSAINLNSHGPPHLSGSTTLTPPDSSAGGLPLRKRMREVDSGYELLYDSEALAVIDELRDIGEGCAAELAMHRNGIVSDSQCYPHRLGYFLRNQFSRLKRARPVLPTPVHGHAPPWAVRDMSTRFSSLRRRRKLRSRQRKLLAATGPSSSRRGQRSRQSTRSPAPNVLSASTRLLSESGYDTGASSSDSHGSCYVSLQSRVHPDFDSVQQQTHRFMALDLDRTRVSNQWVLQEVVPQQPPCSP